MILKAVANFPYSPVGGLLIGIAGTVVSLGTARGLAKDRAWGPWLSWVLFGSLLIVGLVFLVQAQMAMSQASALARGVGGDSRMGLGFKALACTYIGLGLSVPSGIGFILLCIQAKKHPQPVDPDAIMYL